ncbi:MAG: ATP-binding protein, partial [Gammaproteobacteria bacterium]
MTKESLLLRAKALKLYGVIAHWEEISTTDWIESLINWEEEIRSNKSLERRFQSAHLGRFKALALFDWNWPKKCDRAAIEDLMQLDFFKEATNIILCGPNGVGKSTIACNIAHQAILQGHTVLFTTAGQMLKELASKDGAVALNRWIKYYA